MSTTLMNVITIVSSLIGVASFAWAIYEYWSRKKIEDYLKAFTKGYPGSVAKIEQYCRFAGSNIDDAFDIVNVMDDSEGKRKALFYLRRSSGDSKGAGQICHTLFNQLLWNQQAQFGARNIIYADMEPLDLIVAEKKRSEENI